MAVRLPLLGRFSGGTGLLLVASTLPDFGVRIALVIVLLGALLQGARESYSQEWKDRFGRELLPPSLALCTVALGSVLSPLQVGLLAVILLGIFQELLPLVQEGKDEPLKLSIISTVRPLRLSTLLAGLVLLAPAPAGHWLWVAIVPLLLLSTTAAQNFVFKLGADSNLKAVESAERRKEQLEKSREKLKSRLELVHLLLKGCRELAGDLSGSAVSRRLEDVLGKTIPHEAGAILEYRKDTLEPTHTWSRVGLAPRAEDLESVAKSVADMDSALLVDDGSTSGYPAPFQGVASMLGFPIYTEDRMVGVVLLAHRKTAHFDEQQKAVLAVLAVQVGITLDNSRLFDNVLQGKKMLEDSQNQLIQAEKMTAIGQLAAGVAHELNTPLAAIMLSLEASRDMAESAPEAIPPLIGEALTAVERSKEIVDQLLQYSHKSNEQEYVDLSRIATDCANFLNRKLKRDKVTLELETEPHLSVLVCPTNIHQILTNLILNAKDASSGECRVKLVTRREDLICSVWVEDWGQGIAPTEASKIFDPFYTTKEVGHGTGLGLTVSLQLAKQHGGDLSFESKPQGGTIFCLRLPFREPQ